MANNPPPPSPPTAPVVHTYTVVANRDNNPPGHATYTLLQDGVPVENYVGKSGGWDDTTPWASGTYANVPFNGPHSGVPSWVLTIPNRTGILLHTDYNNPSSKTSVGCLVAPPTMLNDLKVLLDANRQAVQTYNTVTLPAYNAQVAAYNAAYGTNIAALRPVAVPKSNINIDVQGDDRPATITLSSITPSALPDDKTGNSNTFVKLQVGLTKAISKDVWVFVKVNNPDDPNHAEFTSSNINKSVLVLDSSGRPLADPTGALNVGGGTRSGNVGFQLDITGDTGGASRNPSDRSQNGFWVRIPAGQTSEEVDVKPAYNNTQGRARTETFTIADYGIVYNGNSSRTPSLYQDGLNGADAHTSNLLTGGQRNGASASITLNDELTSASTLGSVFILPPAPGQTAFRYPHDWTFDVDPDKPHTFTVGWYIGAAPVQITRMVVQKLDGSTAAVKYTQISSGIGFAVYSIDPKSLQGTEGQITVEGMRDDPHGFNISIDSTAQQPQSPLPNLIQGPNQPGQFQADFTPPDTGTPNTSTSTYDNGVWTSTTTDGAGDVIYREVDNADGTREVEIYKITDQPFTSTDRTYDASGNVTATTLYETDGTVYLSGTGTLNADGTTSVLLLDASGATAGVEIDQPYNSYQPGTAVVTLYATAGQPYPAVENDFGPYGALQSRKYFDASGAVYKTEAVSIAPDGSTVGNFYDAGGALIETRVTGIQGEPYVSSDSTYDSAGNLAAITRFAADGSVYETGTATVDANGTTTVVYDDSSGALAELDVLNADGSKQISIFNVVGQPYTTSVTDYDPYGRILSQTLDYANGNTYQTTTFDPNIGNTTILTYDPSGAMTSKEIDNGTRDITTYGIIGEPYSALEVLYDFQGNVASRTYFNNDGTREVIEYPSPFTLGSVKTDTIYDTEGRLTSQTIYNTDDTVASTETVVWNADGSSNVQFRNGAGLLTSQEIDGADGSRDVTTYDVPGQMLPSTEKVYDASQTLLSTTIANADGSRNVTVFGVTGQIYASARTFYDPSGVAIAQDFFDSNGAIVQSDTIAHGADGSMTTRVFDGSGVLTGLQVVHADGSADVTAYGDSGIPYVKSLSHLNAAGTLVSETFYNSDGSVQQTEAVTSNPDGSSTADVTDAGGNLTSRTITAADGSSEVLSYGPASQVQSDTFYDASGNVRSATIYNEDGSIGETESVAANADGSTTTSFFDATGTLIQQGVVNADGSGTMTVYGITDQAYYSTVEATDVDGVTVSDTYLNNDGTRDVVTYPASGPYAQVDSHYDAGGVLLGKQLLDAGGAVVLTGTIATAADGSVTTRYVDSTGTLAEVEVDRTDGTSSITRYGVTGQPYGSTEIDYDASGNATSASYFRADGSLYRTETVTANNDDGSITLNFYDATGTLLETDVDAADGSSDIAVFGITGQSYTSSDSQYDATGTLLSQTRNNADGTRDVWNYGLSDPDFASSDSHYDASGTLLTMTLLKSDGSTFLVGSATTDASGVITIDYQDTSGNLLRQEIDDPYGSRDVRVYQIAGQPYTSTATHYYGSADAGVTTFYTSDQSVYQTIYFSFNTDGSGYQAIYNSSFINQETDSFNSDGSRDVGINNSPVQYAFTQSHYNADGSLASTTITYPDFSSLVDVYGIGNEPYVSTSTFYNYFGQLTSVTRLNADGSVYQTGTPAASQGPAGTFTMDYVNAAGVLASVEISRVDGSSQITTYLITGQPYTSTTGNYNASGNLTSETFFNADGSTYGATHFVYDPSGNLLAQAFFNGDGSVNYATSVSNGVTTTNYFNAGGALDHKTVANSDGTTAQFQYGITGEPYTSTERDYDASGALTRLTLFNADGSREVDAYGITGQPYASTRSQYSAGGGLSSETFYNADGTVYLLQNSVANADGSTTTTVTDGEGALVDQTVRNVDGSSVDHTYRVIGQPYASTISNFDASGNLTSETFYAADGSLYQSEVVATDLSGTTTSTVTNAAGSLASTNIVAADGSSVYTIYGIVGLPYTSVAASYDASGNLTLETFYGAGATIYQTVSVTETANPDGSTTVTYVGSNGTTATYTYNADGTARVSVADFLADQASLDASGSISVQDTAANILGAYATLTADAQVTLIVVADTAANIVANLDALNADAAITSIEITGNAPLPLSVAQVFAGGAALGKISGSYTIAVSDSAANVLANATALHANARIVSITVADTAANIAGVLDELSTVPFVSSIVLTDAGVLTLSAAQVVGDAAALGRIAGGAYAIAIVDSAANVSANFDALNANTRIASIALDDGGTPALLLSAAQALNDGAALREVALATVAFTVAVSDTAAHIAANAAALAGDGGISSIAVVDTSANVSANFGALSGISALATITLTDSGALRLTAGQALDSGATLAKISNASYAIAVVDSASNVAAHLDALNGDSKVGAITLTGPGTPTLILTAAQAAADAVALGKITNPSYALDIAGSGSDVVNVSASLQASSFAFDAANAAWTVSAGAVTEHLIGIERVVDGAGHRFLLVGAGSQYATIQQAVNAASNGDTIEIAPGSYSGNISIAGKAITLEGSGGVTVHGSITGSGTLNGALTIDGLAIDATGQQYGVLVSANSTNYAGSVTIDNSSIANAKLNGFAYIESGNNSTPTHGDTIGAISILNSSFTGNATQVGGANGRGDILLYGYNRDFTVSGVSISSPGAGAQKAIQIRGIQSSTDVADVGPYRAAGNVSLTNLAVSGTYAQDLLAFYRIGSFASFATSGVVLNAAAPWGLFNFDEVGGTIDLSGGITATNLASGAPIAVEQGLGTDSTLIGTGGNDVLVPRGGNDTLDGGGGANTYIYSSGGGNDVIEDGGSNQSGLVFANIASTGVTLSRPNGGDDLVITVAATGKLVTVADEFFWTGQGALKSIAFSDGVSWTLQQVEQKLLDQESAANGGAVYGYSGNDTLVAGPGDKYLNGEGGSDTYLYSSADGNDIVDDPGYGVSTLRLTDVASIGVTLSRPNGGNDLILNVTATGETIKVDNEFFWTGQGALAAIVFSDGASWSHAQVEQILLGQESAANGGAVYGYSGNDTLIAGPGDKYLNGEGGSDTYVYASTDGNDIVDDPGYAASTLQLTDVASTGVTLSRPNGGNDLVLHVTATGKTIKVDNEFFWTGQGALAAIAFSDGVSWDQQEIENILANQGGGGYQFNPGDGQVTVASNVGTLTMGSGISAGDLLLQADGSGDLFIRFRNDSSDLITVQNDLTMESWGVASAIGSIAFNDGTTLSLGQPAAGQGEPLTFTWLGNSPYNTLYGSGFGSNVFEISTYNISINFANGASIGGSNIVDYALGSGQTDVYLNGGTGEVDFGSGISAQDVYWQANGSGDLFLKIRNDNSDSITIHNDLAAPGDGTVTSAVGQIRFGDGMVEDLGQGPGGGGPLTFTWLGNSPYNTLYGSGFGSNVFEISTYNISINFANAAAVGGTNIVEYAPGSGQTDIYLNGGTGEVDFGAGIAASDVYLEANGSGDLILKVRNDNSDSIVVHNDLAAPGNGTVTSAVKQLHFSDGSVEYLGQSLSQGGPLTFTWLGNSPYSAIYGSGYGSNVFEISTHNISVNFANAAAVGGTNIVKYALGSGQTDIYLNGGTGEVDFGAGIAASGVYLEANGSGDLILKIRNDNSDSIVVHNDLAATGGTVTSAVNQLRFSDGSVEYLGQSPGQSGALTFTWLGNSPYSAIYGSGYGSNLYQISTHNISVNFANTAAVGGSNVVDYALGSGQTDIYLNGGTGEIDFGAGIAASDVYLQANGSGDLILRIRNDNSDTIVVHNDLVAPGDGTVTSAVNQLHFSDGSVEYLGQSLSQGGPLTFTWLGNSPYSSLPGSSYGSNIFEITTHNVSVNFANAAGVGGANTVDYAPGSGQSDIYLNGGTGAIDFGAGVSAQDVYLQASGSDLIVRIRNDANDAIIVHSDLAQQSWGVSSGVRELDFADGTSMALGQPASGQGAPLSLTWTGAAFTNMSGSSFASNVFEFGAGPETATGGTTASGGPGNNTYKVSTGTGQATIQANEFSGTTNELDFTGGITDQNLWFLHSGNDLRIDLVGTQTEVSIKDWFSGSTNQLQEITASGLRIDSQVSQLVQAMATYSANHSGFDPTASGVSTVPNDAGVQTAMAAAWHA